MESQIDLTPERPEGLLISGQPLEQAGYAMVLIHGRGATAASILELQQVFPFENLTFVAPQAAGNSWYPYSFLAPFQNNEPFLTAALQTVKSAVEYICANGMDRRHIVIGGFSQGACLAAEFVARNPGRYGGLLVFSGGLIGPPGTAFDHAGCLEGTPVFLGCSDVDFHIPVDRVEETANVLSAMGGEVTKKIYPGMGHTIIQDEIDNVIDIVSKLMRDQS